MLLRKMITRKLVTLEGNELDNALLLSSSPHIRGKTLPKDYDRCSNSSLPAIISGSIFWDKDMNIYLLLLLHVCI